MGLNCLDLDLVGLASYGSFEKSFVCFYKDVAFFGGILNLMAANTRI